MQQSTIDIVQAAPDFGISKPVLQALQDERLLQPPLPELFTGDHSQVALLDAPVWQNDEDVAKWVQAQLDMFDKAQRSAFDGALRQRVALVQGPPGGQHCLLDGPFVS